MKFLNLLLNILLVFLLNCNPDVKEDSSSRLLLLLGIGSKCGSLDACFDKFVASTDEGASLQVFNSSGVRIYARSSGLDYSTYKPIASGSKWVTAVVAMRAIQSGTCTTGTTLTLSTTTSQALGWTGTKGSITLRQLLAFTSGLNAGNLNGANCISSLPTGAGNTEKDACADSIRDNSTGTPGQLFVYNSNHMAIAMRMMEKTCNKTWNQLFTDTLVTPLNWDSSQAIWKGNTQSDTTTTDGSMSGAYGLTISSEAYARMLSALLRNGTARNASGDVANFLSSNNVSEILNDQFNGATIGYSQFASFGYRWQYGLGNWRFCSVPATPSECDKDLLSHSLGINGFYPFLDRNRGYYAILAVNNIGRKNSLPLLPPTVNSLFFVETIRPFIHTILSQ